MYSEKKIIKIFKLLGLASSKERNRFRNMSKIYTETTTELPRQFMKKSSGSSRVELEEKDAELESNP